MRTVIDDTNYKDYAADPQEAEYLPEQIFQHLAEGLDERVSATETIRGFMLLIRMDDALHMFGKHFSARDLLELAVSHMEAVRNADRRNL